MAKSLVIVESPAKAKTINKYLGNDYIVKSSVGHVRDLAKNKKEKTAKTSTKSKSDIKLSPEEKSKINLVNNMGIDPYNGWEANYELLEGKEKVVAELKALAKKVDHVYLATDLDREGEAIAWHLRQVIGGDDSFYSRVIFNEITKNAIQEAFANPNVINIDRVNAQQTRRFLDRIVGFMMSPILWKKVARGLSAGRVQSVALSILSTRERDIKAFQPQEYWEITADTKTNNEEEIKLDVVKYKDKKLSIENKQDADSIKKALEKATYKLVERESKPTNVSPKPPFITSTLQQAASTRLQFGIKRTMMLAQNLYEAGYITYMRTDSTNLSQDSLDMARTYIKKQFGDKYLPAKANYYASKTNAQEAHEAIRPSDVSKAGVDLVNMDPSAVRLYDMIRNRFLACQMTAAEYNATNLTVQADDYTLKTKGRVLIFDGWLKAFGAQAGKNDLTILPNIEVGEQLTLTKINNKQCFTKPPARYNEASLVKELEKSGIGRPSTYATIISTLQDRGYVQIQNRVFYVEKIGEIVADRLSYSFPRVMGINFTATMEDMLDHVANGDTDWKAELDEFFEFFTKRVKLAEQDEEDGGMPDNKAVPVNISCPECGRDMAIRTASTGVFLGCTGYNLPVKERCKKTLNLIPEMEVLNILDDSAETTALLQRKRCPICDTAMDSYILNESNRLYICGNNPNCPGYTVEKGEFKIKGYDGPVIECDKCGQNMQLKLGRFGKYMGCMNAECKNTRKILKNGEIAPPKEDPVHFPELKCSKSDAYFVLRDGASGVFMAANNFPKSRETRAPFVAELAKYKDRLPEKLAYLATAPVKDPDGNPSIVRFSRKEKSQYVTSNTKEGKATKWIMDYINDKWVARKK